MPTYSFSYSIPYLLMGIFWLMCAIGEKKFSRSGTLENNIFPKIAVVGYFIFFTGRGLIGWDWLTYEEAYNDCIPLFSRGFFNNFSNERLEPGYILAMAIQKTVCDDFFVFRFIWTVIDVICFYDFFKKYSCNISLSFYFLFALNMSLQVDLLRNIKALLLIYLSLQYIEKRELAKFIICLMAALLFHYSSILFLPAYWFLNKRYPAISLIIIFSVANIIYVLQISVFSSILQMMNLFGNYKVYVTEATSRGITNGYIFYIVLLCAVLYQQFSEKDDKMMIFYNTFYLLFLAFLLLFDFSVIANRIGIMLSYSLWILIPYIVYKSPKVHLRVCLLLLCLGYTSYKLVNPAGTGNISYRYDNIFVGKLIPYEDRYDARTYDCEEILRTQRGNL